MGTTSEKLTYLNTTKSELKQAINNLGGNIDSETTFREYVEELQDVYDNYPKTSYGEGTSVTLENCNKGKLDFEKLEGDTEQDSTQGYNLFNASLQTTTSYDVTITRNNDGTYSLSGTSSITQVIAIGTFTPSVSGNYKLVGCPSGGAENTYKLGIKLPNLSADTGNGAVNSLESGATGNVAFIIYEGVNVDGLVFKPMITTDTSKTYDDFEPYTNGASPNPSYPQPIQSVTGNQNVVVRGKNLLDTQYYQRGSIDASTGQDTINDLNARGSNYIPVKPNTTITFSAKQNLTDIRLSEYTGNKTNILRTSSNLSKSVTITTSANTYYIRWSLNYDNVTTTTQEIIDSLDLMICEGTSTTYEPYHTPITKTLALGDRKVFEGDYLWIDKTTGKKYHHHKIGETIFDGVNNLFESKSGTTANVCLTTNAISNIKPVSSHDEQADLICDYFLASTANRLFTNNIYGIALMTSNKLFVGFTLNGSISSAEQGNTWLTTHPMSVVYPLATETDEEITGTLAEQLEALYNAQSITGTTIIETSGNLPIIVKVRSLKGV